MRFEIIEEKNEPFETTEIDDSFNNLKKTIKGASQYVEKIAADLSPELAKKIKLEQEQKVLDVQLRNQEIKNELKNAKGHGFFNRRWFITYPMSFTIIIMILGIIVEAFR